MLRQISLALASRPESGSHRLQPHVHRPLDGQRHGDRLRHARSGGGPDDGRRGRPRTPGCPLGRGTQRGPLRRPTLPRVGSPDAPLYRRPLTKGRRLLRIPVALSPCDARPVIPRLGSGALPKASPLLSPFQLPSCSPSPSDSLPSLLGSLGLRWGPSGPDGFRHRHRRRRSACSRRPGDGVRDGRTGCDHGP